MMTEDVRAVQRLPNGRLYDTESKKGRMVDA